MAAVPVDLGDALLEVGGQTSHYHDHVFEAVKLESGATSEDLDYFSEPLSGDHHAVDDALRMG